SIIALIVPSWLFRNANLQATARATFELLVTLRFAGPGASRRLGISSFPREVASLRLPHLLVGSASPEPSLDPEAHPQPAAEPLGPAREQGFRSHVDARPAGHAAPQQRSGVCDPAHDGEDGGLARARGIALPA